MSEEMDAAMRRRYRNAVDALPEKQREIFLAHRLDGMSYPEIAERMGLTVRQVERQLAKALYKLCKQMEGEPLRWWDRWF